jgi:RND family efflux transporter MFP subunit
MSEQNASSLSSLRIERDKDKFQKRIRRYGRKKWYYIIGGALLLILLMFMMRGSGGAPHVEAAVVAKMYPAQLHRILVASGYVVAQRKANVASKATGRLVALNAVEGDRVRRDEVIARLESSDIVAALAQAKANVENARASLLQAKAEEQDATSAFNRSQALVKAGSISQSEFEIADARAKRARAGVSAAEAGIRAVEAAVRATEVQLENTYIRAPFDGTVLTKNADVGEVVAPFGAATNSKGAVVTMADMASLEVEADVSESNIEKIGPDQPCEIILDAYPEQRYRGSVSKIVPTADRAKATVLTKVRFANLDGRVLPEMSAKVSFLAKDFDLRKFDEAPRIVVNAAAVLRRNNTDVVFVIKEKKLIERRVSLGQKFESMVEILSGVSDGEKVALRPAENFKDGMSVSLDGE